MSRRCACMLRLLCAPQVMYARQHERQAMKDALEMALLTSVSHPFIIHVYSCFTDMVEDASGANSTSSAASPTNTAEGQINVRFRKLQPDEDRALATCNILVSPCHVQYSGERFTPQQC